MYSRPKEFYQLLIERGANVNVNLDSGPHFTHCLRYCLDEVDEKEDLEDEEEIERVKYFLQHGFDIFMCT